MTVSNRVINPISNIDENTFNVLKETLYPGAKDESIQMVINYCRARKLDPIKKPVHLVPMSVKTDKKDAQGNYVYEYRDVVMPGIGLYRIEADRSGQYAGMSEPEFGEDVTEIIGTVKVTYPKWCKITVHKYVGDRIVGFTAKEFWKENYATKSRKDISPNSMWEKRAYGQLAKCAEAQALRKAFPDAVGQDYTKEEMEGKTFDVDPIRKPINENKLEEDNTLIIDYNDFLSAIDKSENEDQLKSVWQSINKSNFKSRPDLFKNLVDAKDKRKNEISVLDFNKEIDSENKNETL